MRASEEGAMLGLCPAREFHLIGGTDLQYDTWALMWQGGRRAGISGGGGGAV